MTQNNEISIIMNPKTLFTRKCITEAILQLMQNHRFEKLTVTSVVKRAGIARMTFYLHYNSLTDALTDYLQIIIGEFEAAALENKAVGHLRDYSHILFALNFYDQYRDYFLALSRNGLQYILLDGINKFMEKYYKASSRHSVYEMYCYSGGLLNVFLKWEEEGKRESAENVAAVICDLYNQRRRVS